ncbi:hypothetical protein KVH22_25350 [Streptomyces olivaceus]|uniref:hypothetical protein n=1 Tax=Streptomyces olivaceus TaxID=47716 RepID=UPI001CD02678|nr:hypothetical protein [Streptomyces olivaceus]MBZ6258845.1 hypothetical protein [Streptomyces olivaceus]
MILIVLWPLAALLAALGLRALAPRRAPGLYLGPAVCTVTVLFIAVAYTAAVWSH